jgi:hypothetical protein
MVQKIQKYLSVALLLAVVISMAVPAAVGATANQTYYGDLGRNYYSFYGSPDLFASVQGNGEYASGQTASVPIVLTNKGVMEGFKAENEVKNLTSINGQLNLTLQKMEVENVNGILTAVGVTAVLESNVEGISVKTSAQEVGSLPTGSSSSPVRYSIDIQNGLPAGEYELTLNVTYKHLRNVIYSADAIEGIPGTLTGIKNLNASYWYNENVTRQIPVIIKIKEDTRFEIVDIEHNLSSGSGGMLYVTYKNSGEKVAKSSFVRLSTATPFSTTDDQSYIGDVAPGDTVVAKFKLSVDSDSLIYDKLYGINSEILYEDTFGHQVVSDPLKVPVQISKEPFWNTTTIIIAIVIIIAAAVIIYYVVMSQKYKKEGSDKKPFGGLLKGNKKE